MAMTLRDELLLGMIAEGPYEPAEEPEGWTDDDSSPCPYCQLDLWSQRPDGTVVCGSCGLVTELR